MGGVKKFLCGAAVLAVAVGGLVAIANDAAAAAVPKPTIVAGSGSAVRCNITAVASLAPVPKDDWVQAQHSTDPDPAVAALPDSDFSAPGPSAMSLKGNGTCSGNVTNGFDAAPVTSVKFTVSVDPSHPGSPGPATCASLLAGSSTRYISNFSWKATGATIAPSVVMDSTVAISNGSMSIAGGTVTGSFAGGSASTQGPLDAVTVGALEQAPPSSSSPTPTFKQCQPTLKVQDKRGVQSASLLAPKGLKTIRLTTGSALAATVMPPTDRTAFVVDNGVDEVTPIDLSTGKAGTAIPVGPSPGAIAVTPDGATAYVVNSGDNSVTPIDTSTFTAGAPIALRAQGQGSGIAIAPNGLTAYVADGDAGVVPIDLTDDQAEPPINVLIPEVIAITPDGSAAFTNVGSCCYLGAIDLATKTLLGGIQVRPVPQGIAFTPNGATGYVSNTAENTVTVFNPTTETSGAVIPVGTNPGNIAVAPNGGKAYVINRGDNTVTPITVATETAGSVISVGAAPTGIAISPDGSEVYVTNYDDNTVTPIGTSTNTPGIPIGVGSGPAGIAID